MTWIQTTSGMDVDLIDPKSESILLGDISHSLARMARFNGHTIGDIPWNVAQHSVLVESLLPDDADPATRLHALLHDAHEAYIGDIVSPLHKALDKLKQNEDLPESSNFSLAPSSYLKEIATRLDIAIFAAFGLRPTKTSYEMVATADLLALRIEADGLMAPRRREWSFLPASPMMVPVLTPLEPSRAEDRYLNRFDKVRRLRHGLS